MENTETQIMPQEYSNVFYEYEGISEYGKYERFTFRTEERFISHYEFDHRVNIFRTHFGSGKTQLAINEIKRTGQRFVFIALTRSLLNDILGRLKQDGIYIKSHMEVNEENDLFYYENNLLTCLESLHKIDFSKYKDTIFIFDEFSSLLTQLESRINNDRRIKILEVLEFIFKNCKVAAFDALFEKFDLDFIYNYIENKDDISFKNEIFSIVDNTRYTPKKREVTFIYSKGTFDNLIKTDNRKILFMTATKNYGNEVVAKIKEQGRNAAILSRETREELLKDNTVNSLIESEEIDFLAITPTGFVGLNITEKFEAVYLCLDNHSMIDYRIFLQAIHRLRDYEIPIYIHCQETIYNPTLELNPENILRDYDKTNRSLSALCRDKLNKDGFWESRPEYKHYEIFLANKRAWINQNINAGLYSFIESYYEKYNNPIRKIYKAEDLEKKSVIRENREEKRERLKSIKLLDKIEFDKLKRKQASKDLTKEESDSIEKYRLAERLGIGLTDINREELVNSIYDKTVNDEKIDSITNRIKALRDLDASHEFEKKHYQYAGVDLFNKSLTTECKLISDFIEHCRGKYFDKTDISETLIKNLEDATGKNRSIQFESVIIQKDCYKKLVGMGIKDSLLIDYCKAIAEGDIETINAVFGNEISESLNEIFEKAMQSKDKGLERVKSRSKNPLTIEKNIAKFEKDFFQELKSKLAKKKDSLIKNYIADFKISPIDILSEILSNYGISLDKKKSHGKRSYKLNLELFDKLLGH